MKTKTQKLLVILVQNPYQSPRPDKKLVGDLADAYSRRNNIQHRLIYQALDDIRTVKILRIWTLYE